MREETLKGGLDRSPKIADGRIPRPIEMISPREFDQYEPFVVNAEMIVTLDFLCCVPPSTQEFDEKVV